MIKLKDIITETYLNLHTEKDKLKYVDDVFPLVLASYSRCGGYKSMECGQELRDELINQASKPNFWKLCKRGNEITAAVFYKQTPYGLKSILSAQNGTQAGKTDLFKIKTDEIVQGRAYAEVSGKMEHVMMKFGANRLKNSVADKILPYKIIPDEDGYHYFRIINGAKQRKILVGKLRNID